MKNLVEDFKIGDNVNVERLAGDLFNHDFTGHVTGLLHNNIIVQDQDGDCWECERDQVSHSSDDVMHKS